MKSIKLITTVILALAFTTTQAQWKTQNIKGNGNVQTKSYTTSAYEEVQVGGNFHVTLTEGNVGAITLKAESNLIEHIVIETKGNALHIKTEKNTNLKPSSGKRIEVTVPVGTLTKVSLAGSGEITSSKTIQSEMLAVRLAGSGDMELSVKTTSLEVSVAGSGNIILTGTTTDLKGSIAGSGDANLEGLKSTNAEVKIAGSGNFKVNCTEMLEAKIAGSGNIYYIGNPTKLKTSEAGSGKIKTL
ncbi:MAG: head GIN domain-containing protein [Flavobacteriaceae bacterium]